MLQHFIIFIKLYIIGMDLKDTSIQQLHCKFINIYLQDIGKNQDLGSLINPGSWSALNAIPNNGFRSSAGRIDDILGGRLVTRIVFGVAL